MGNIRYCYFFNCNFFLHLKRDKDICINLSTWEKGVRKLERKRTIQLNATSPLEGDATKCGGMQRRRCNEFCLLSRISHAGSRVQTASMLLSVRLQRRHRGKTLWAKWECKSDDARASELHDSSSAGTPHFNIPQCRQTFRRQRRVRNFFLFILHATKHTIFFKYSPFPRVEYFS